MSPVDVFMLKLKRMNLVNFLTKSANVEIRNNVCHFFANVQRLGYSDVEAATFINIDADQS